MGVVFKGSKMTQGMQVLSSYENKIILVTPVSPHPEYQSAGSEQFLTSL